TRSALTTPTNKHLGYVTIIHPFHPWNGECFQILSRNLNNKNILNVRTSTGKKTIIPLDWTDRAEPSPYEVLGNLSPILSFPHLQQMVKLVASIDQATNDKGVDQ
ncbi:MAG: DUF5372 family protein, partial [Wolbachia sp.]